MKPLPLIIGFTAGLVVAGVVDHSVVLPASRQAWRVNMDSDVHWPMEKALGDIEQSAAQGDCEKAAAKLRLLNKRFGEYRSGGPTPANWWTDVIATSQPSRKG